MKRQKSAEQVLGELGASCRLLETGQVLYLYPKGQIPDSAMSRAYSHVADDYSLYQVGQRYLLEFREQCNQDVVYRALFLSTRPDTRDIGELFDKQTQLRGHSATYLMTEFDQLAELTQGHNKSQNDEANLKAIFMFFGLTFTGLALVGTEDRHGEPTSPLSRLGLGLIGSGFLYLGKKLF